jgi:hypothetical protein
MIYFTCFFDAVSFVEIFTKYNYKVVDGDGEFQCKVDVSNLVNFENFISYLKSTNNTELLTLLEDHCHDFESDQEEFDESIEDEIYNLITN